MYSIQSNSARFIYTLHYRENKNNSANNVQQCKLRNGLYFSKESRSDEKIRYTETDMYSIIRTALFIQVFDSSPEENIVEIVNSGQVTHIKTLNTNKPITISSLVDMVDSLFGTGFSFVASRVINKCYNEYVTRWRYYPYISKIKYPSAADYINLAKFVNVSVYEYGDCELFITTNSTDHKIPMQGSKKII